MAGLVVATTLAAALDRLTEPGARALAGGVGIMLARARGVDPGGDLVAIGLLPDLLRSRTDAEGTIELGAAITLESLAEPHDEDTVPALLRAAAGAAANPGIRSVATVGGNVVDTGAASDLVAALIALGAQVRIVRRGDSRVAALADLWASEGAAADDDPSRLLISVALRPGELIQSLTIPPPAPIGWGWERLTLHGAMDRSAASLAVTILPDGRARVALTAAVTLPIRLAEVERLVQATAAMGAPPGPELVARIRDAAREDLAAAPVLTDDRAPAAYRRQVVPVLAERAVVAALDRARVTANA